MKPRKGLLAFAATVAISAYGGAVGLATGADLGHELNQRLPFHSPVFAAVALAVIVGVPSTVVAAFAKRGDPRTDTVLAGAGVLLIGWIAVELAFIRAIAFLQIAYVIVGIVYIALGRRGSPRVDVGARPSGARSR